MPQTEYFGIGTIHKLEEVLAKEKPHKIFLVTGSSSYISSGAAEKVRPILQPYSYVHFSDFSPNPKIEDIEKGMELYRRENCDLTLAIGGGSVLDVAKAINILSAQAENPAIYIRGEKKAETKGKPLIAIPTTSGSGSEATSFAVVYINKSKYSLYHPQFMLPDYAIIDSEMTFTCSPHLTACSGMDALAQAIESYWSTNANPISQTYSKEAIELILAHLEKAVNSPTPESRTNMSRAANLAGKAINITATTACHAISYPFTSYFNVPHGHAVALTLGEMVAYNAKVQEEDCMDGRGVAYVQKVMKEISQLFGMPLNVSGASNVSSPETVREKINSLMAQIGLERNLSKLGVKSEEEMQRILNNVNVERLKNNPRRLTSMELKNILEKQR